MFTFCETVTEICLPFLHFPAELTPKCFRFCYHKEPIDRHSPKQVSENIYQIDQCQVSKQVIRLQGKPLNYFHF